jgi:tetratricopeptide (TPR) repeat protein
MTAGDAERVMDLFAAARVLPTRERADFLARTGVDSDAVRAEVAGLLDGPAPAAGFLSEPVYARGLSALADAGEESELRAGDMLVEYRIVELLGTGGMGEVYLADDTALGRRVALKLIQRGPGSQLLHHFRHERRVLAGLTHPNIARLYGGAVTPEGRAYLVMEYVEGEPLDEHCHRRQLDLAARLALFRKVCAAVAYAHQNLVVHRDLKPANIRVTAEGEPKLLDFGIAKLLDADTARGADRTVTLHRAATPGYASPEQLRAEPITTASDVYSLGVVLYELLTGQRPHEAAGRRADAFSRAVCEEDPPRPSAAVSGKMRRLLAGDLDNIVAKALAQEPARRYSSVATFAEDVRRHTEGLSISARRDTLAYRTGKFVRRNKLGVALALLLLLTLVGGLIAVAWEGRRAARRFEDVRRMAKSMLFEVEPSIANVAGTTSARALLTRRALEYLDSLSLEAGGDRELRRELAASYERVGDVQGNPAGANLGDLKGGLASYGKARAIRRALAAASPHDVQVRHELANHLEQAGTMRWWNSDTAGALADYGEALALRRALLAEQPRRPDFRRGLASTLMRKADVDTWNTRNADALADLQEALPVLQQLLAETPGDAAAQLDVARCFSRLGVLRRETGDYAAAFDALHQAESIMELLLAREPDNRAALLQYANELAMEDEAYLAQEPSEGTARALALSPRLIGTLETVANKDPQDTAVQHDLALACYDFGTALLHAERWQEALERLQRGESIDSRLAAQSPENAEYMHSRGYFHTGMGEARLHLGQLEAAAADAETARQCAESIVAKDPGNAQARREFVSILILCGRIDIQRARPTQARQSFQRAQEELNALIAKKITNKADAEDSRFLRSVLKEASE